MMKVIDLTSTNEDEVSIKKKMKQPELPFRTTSPKSNLCNNKKRKLSNTSLAEECAIKQVRTEKENISDDINKDEILIEPDTVIKDTDNITQQSVESNIFNSSLNLNVKSYSDIQKSEKLDIQVPEENEIVTGKGCETNHVSIEHLNEGVNDSVIDEVKSNNKSQKSFSMLVKPFNENMSDDSPLILLSDSDDSIKSSSSESEDIDDMNTNNESNSSSHSSSVKINDSHDKIQTPVNTQTLVKKLTPKQIQFKVESAKKKEERTQQKLEREKKKLQEKEERLKLKQEQQEQKKKKREERDEQKRKEREEKEKKRQQELDIKSEERKMKDEAKRLKEEDKRRKEEEKLKKEQERELLEEKKRKAAKAFVSFFVPKKSDERFCSSSTIKEQSDKIKEHIFMPFAIKSDMRVAPLTRHVLNSQQIKHLDGLINHQNIQSDLLYLSELKNGKILGKSLRTWPIDDDVIVVEDTDMCSNVVETVPVENKMKVKLLQFSENRRPPYWGTWRKSSLNVKPRKPFGLDKRNFDYDVDSDEEWEEEEPGESLHGSDDEKDKESEDEYEVDNEFFVPHGYLSDEEAQNEEDEMLLTPETQKARLKYLELEFEAEMKHKTERLKPRLIGCVWESKDSEKPTYISDSVWQYLSKYEMIFNEERKNISFSEDNLDAILPLSEDTVLQKKFTRFPDKYIPDFIKLIHGNSNSRMFLTKEFQAYLLKTDINLNVSKRNIQRYLQDLASWRACPDQGPVFGKTFWYVDKATREKYNSEAVLPNVWNYILTPKRKSLNYSFDSVNDNTEESLADLKKNEHNIKKFTKVMSEEERKQKFTSANILGSNSCLKKGIKKRVQLTTLSNFVSSKMVQNPLQNDHSKSHDSNTVAGNSAEESKSILKEKKQVSFITPSNELESTNIHNGVLTNTDFDFDNKNINVSNNMKLIENANKEKENIKKKRVPFVTLSKNSVKTTSLSRESLLTQFVSKLEENEIQTCNDMKIEEKVLVQPKNIEVKKKRVQLISLPSVEEKPIQVTRENLLSKFITKMEEKDKKIKEINEREFSIPFESHSTSEEKI